MPPPGLRVSIKQLQSLLEPLRCPMCKGMLNDPHLLPCGHSFCDECARPVVDDFSMRKCPQCALPCDPADMRPARTLRNIIAGIAAVVDAAQAAATPAPPAQGEGARDTDGFLIPPLPSRGQARPAAAQRAPAAEEPQAPAADAPRPAKRPRLSCSAQSNGSDDDDEVLLPAPPELARRGGARQPAGAQAGGTSAPGHSSSPAAGPPARPAEPQLPPQLTPTQLQSSLWSGDRVSPSRQEPEQLSAAPTPTGKVEPAPSAAPGAAEGSAAGHPDRTQEAPQAAQEAVAAMLAPDCSDADLDMPIGDLLRRCEEQGVGETAEVRNCAAVVARCDALLAARQGDLARAGFVYDPKAEDRMLRAVRTCAPAAAPAAAQPTPSAESGRAGGSGAVSAPTPLQRQQQEPLGQQERWAESQMPTARQPLARPARAAPAAAAVISVDEDEAPRTPCVVSTSGLGPEARERVKGCCRELKLRFVEEREAGGGPQHAAPVAQHQGLLLQQRVTHLITTDPAPRTLKYCCALLRGRWVVCEEWLRASVQRGLLVHEEKYEVASDTGRGGGDSRVPAMGRLAAIARARGDVHFPWKGRNVPARLPLAGYRFALCGSYTGNPSRGDLAKLAVLAGGQAVDLTDLVQVSPAGAAAAAVPASVFCATREDVRQMRETLPLGVEALPFRRLLHSICSWNVET
eukprot:TRINITY_DN2512_c1_g1_i2.p1 TRINITY_DN2512_c1_g1~~TRINITY_DN2512_c1_g1_i2.p1  ORF type:complete len:716 (+),score=132.07 TRINITY_DN2512_c1_g1_i2:88-2148(+)